MSFRFFLITALFVYQVVFPSFATAISVSSFSPASGAIGVKKNKILRIYFNNNWYASMGSVSRYVTVYHSEDDSVFASKNIASEVGGGGGNQMSIYSMTFTTGTYYVLADGGIVKSSSDASVWSGISDPTTWTFTVDATGPVITTLSPADDSTNVNPGTGLTITFDENIYPYSGYVYLKKTADNNIVESFRFATGSIGSVSSTVSVSGNQITINPTNPLYNNTGYYVTIDSTAVKDAAANFYAGMSSNTAWNFNTGSQFYCGYTCGLDFTIPDPVFTPLDNATGVSLTSNLEMLFNAETMNIGSPTALILIKKGSDNSTVESIFMNSAQITISHGDYIGNGTQDTRITVNPTASFTANTAYYIDIGCDALKNASNKEFGIDSSSNTYGVDGKTIWNFTTTAADVTAPTVSTLTPTDNSTGISVSTNLTIVFTEAVNVETGNVVIKKSSDNSTIETISISGGLVSGDGTDTITINPSTTLLNNTAYYVQIDATAIDDLAGNSYAGISNTTSWNFTTVADTTAPTISSFSPADNATGVSTTADLVMNFDEDVQQGIGNILIKRSSNDSTVQTINVATVTVSGSQVTINPSDFSPNNGYYINLAAGVIEDLAGNDYAGISNTSTWNFTTGALDYPILQTSYPPPTDTTYSRNNIRVEFDKPVTLSPGVSNMVCKTGSHSGTTVFTVPLTSASTTADPAIIKIPPVPPGLLPGTTIFCQFAGSALPAQAGSHTNPGNFQFQIKLDPAPIIAPGF